MPQLLCPLSPLTGFRCLHVMETIILLRFFSFLLDPFLPYNTAMNALSSSLPSVPELVLPTDLIFMSSSITTITKCSLMLVLYIFNINTVAQSLSGIELHIDVWV